jgi:hypothetical protein
VVGIVAAVGVSVCRWWAVSVTSKQASEQAIKAKKHTTTVCHTSITIIIVIIVITTDRGHVGASMGEHALAKGLVGKEFEARRRKHANDLQRTRIEKRRRRGHPESNN